MKIAIVHDDLMRRGGGEQVALSFCKAFPQAPLYTLCYRPELTYPEFRNFNVRTSWFNRIAKTEAQMKKRFFPLGILAMQCFDFSDYDVLLISSTFCGKYIKVDRKTEVILYCHTPFRLAWYPETYTEVKNAKGPKSLLLKHVIRFLRYIDKKCARQATTLVVNSKEVKSRVEKCYHVDKHISIIHPPVKMDNFLVSPTQDDYYLVVSRFQPYKKVDLVIETFNRLPDKKLIIVGSGDDEEKLKVNAGQNIIFKKGLSASELADLYSKCKAFIFPQYEDFGITALEANASGRPVLAFGAGGVLETMIPFDGRTEEFTALFFEEQSAECLTKTIERFEQIQTLVNPNIIRRNAERFNEANFIHKIQKLIENQHSTRE
jgi:glycosyltransferase involved in cell wall biosynthesis